MKRDNYNRIGLIVIALAMSIIFISGIVSANELKIKTLASHRIAVQILASGEVYNLLESFPYKETGGGELTYNIQTTAKKIDVNVIVTYNGEVTLKNRFSDVDNTKPISIMFLPGDLKVVEETPIVEPPVVNTTNISTAPSVIANETSNETIGKSFLSGFAISSLTGPAKKVFSSKIFYYVVIGILAVGVLAFIMKMIVLKKKPGEIRVKSLSSMVTGGSSDYVIKDEQLLEAERKIKQAQEELDAIKQRKRKVGEAQARYEAAKKELEDARKEEGF